MNLIFSEYPVTAAHTVPSEHTTSRLRKNGHGGNTIEKKLLFNKTKKTMHNTMTFKLT